jgi:hypothetical protein
LATIYQEESKVIYLNFQGCDAVEKKSFFLARKYSWDSTKHWNEIEDDIK